MNQVDGKQTLWANVATLMKLRYGKENMSKLAVDAEVGPATMTRIKEQKTSIGTEKLDQLAKALGVPAWQLLCPGFDFENVAPPTAGDGDKQQDDSLEATIKRLADYLDDADAGGRQQAGRLLAILADAPQSHASIAAMLADTLAPKRHDSEVKKFTKQHDAGEKRHGPAGIDRRLQNRRGG